jgi:hypothetical protein
MRNGAVRQSFKCRDHCLDTRSKIPYPTHFQSVSLFVLFFSSFLLLPSAGFKNCIRNTLVKCRSSVCLINLCVCVCVCEKERERETTTHMKIHNTSKHPRRLPVFLLSQYSPAPTGNQLLSHQLIFPTFGLLIYVCI